MKKIFILHGWAYDTKKWEPFLEKLRRNNVDPILLKIPGLTDKIDKPWNIDDYVNWLDTKLQGQKNIILLGHSNGGKIALSYAIKYPGNINKIFLLNSAGIYHNDPVIRIKRLIFGYLAKFGKKFTTSPVLKNILYKVVGENDYNQSSNVMKETMQNLININLTPKLQEIKTPTIVIWGENDTITPVSDAHVFNNGIKKSKLIVIDNARHSPQFTHVGEVAKIIYEHI